LVHANLGFVLGWIMRHLWQDRHLKSSRSLLGFAANPFEATVSSIPES
jgi:hypothetical protein